ncbi:MAG: hypothetical protein AMJ90_01930 [candidate division Zixibacteria bacterium SM23_73_2]|nr:MAG: hypothetical protein AMJ90_01930 [candidate division Zixibacteria bacterium SM23_73_2]
MRKTGFVYHPDYLRHQTGQGHPENAQRLFALLDYLKKDSLWNHLKQIKPLNPPLKWIEKIHTRDYISSIERVCSSGLGMLDADTLVSLDSYNVAVLAAGGVLAALDEVLGKSVNNAFCAVRPPGHHAETERAMGFCIFNNVAIGARYAQMNHKLNKILIVDWDAHHGNGTQHIFYEDPTVFYFSVHQFPHYPGTGSDDEEGQGEGKGFTLNMPMCAGSGDLEYIEVFENILYPEAIKFSPDLILISAGFDGHKDDPLSNLNLSAAGFKRLTQVVLNVAEECCEGRVVSVLEGGYNLKAFSESVSSHLSALIEGSENRK